MNSIWKKGWPAWLLLIFISGCATLDRPDGESVTTADELTDWSFEGRLGIDDGRQSWQSSVHWVQQGESYRIDLIGPLGQGRMAIRGGPDGVGLHSGDQWLYADDPDELLLQATGFSVPVSGLRHWLLGLTTPDPAAQPVADAEGRLRQLRQTGWLITYPTYIVVDGYSLPQRLQAVREEITVRLLINRWTLG